MKILALGAFLGVCGLLGFWLAINVADGYDAREPRWVGVLAWASFASAVSGALIGLYGVGLLAFRWI
jgi:hypothetical protein